MRQISALVIAAVTFLATSMATAGQSRVALVIGNNAYENAAPLANPMNDARDITAALTAAGFEVIEALDTTKAKLDAALRTFTGKVATADVALFFYSGHGLQVGAQNYLVPIDARLERERDLDFEAVRLDFVLRQMEIDRDGKTSIVFLDACRDNPLTRNLARSMGTRSVAIGRGLAATASGLGTFIAYSTQPGNVALDGDGRNSPFTAALVKQMGVAGRNLPATMIEVRKDVVAATGGRQVPWDHSALTGDFYFTGGEPAGSPTGAAEPELGALQARLNKLEEDAKRREADIAARAAANADGFRLAELRARAANLEDLTKSLQNKLFDARRAEGQTASPAERNKLVRQSMDIQMEWSRRGLDLRKLKDEIAALEGKAAPVPVAAAKDAAVSAQAPKVADAEHKPEEITTKSGLKYSDTTVGTGEPPKASQTCVVHYTGWLYQDGVKGPKFDSSLDRGQPFEFKIGQGQVIKGWDEGVASMKVGGKRTLIVPPDLGYGARGAGGTVPPNATLLFEVELVGLK